MRSLLVLTLSLLILTPLAAQAGQIRTIEGKGRWVSTECQAPVEPNATGKDAEAAANDLNAGVSAHNVFAADVRTYMECLSKEAERDAKAVGKMIIDEASRNMQDMSAKVQKAADSFHNK